jgi:hypothetical protein
MNGLVKCVLKLGSPLWDLFLSTAGCFVFMRDCGLVAAEKEGPDAVTSMCAAGGVSDCSAFSVTE